MGGGKEGYGTQPAVPLSAVNHDVILYTLSLWSEAPSRRDKLEDGP